MGAISMSELQSELLTAGATFVACGDLRELSPDCRLRLPRGHRPEFLSSLSNGVYDKCDPEYDRINELRGKLGYICVELLMADGHRACTVPPELSSANASTLSARLPHKTVATRAGAGWIGKCAMLVTKKFGSAVRLVSVLTDADLPTGIPIDESSCGECRDCVDACPAGAPLGADWRAGCERDSLFNARACMTFNESELKCYDLRHHPCQACVAVCPWTKKYVSLLHHDGQRPE